MRSVACSCPAPQVRHHGFVGAALSQSYTDALSLILTVAVYVRHELALPPDRRTWPGAAGLPDALLRGWAPYFALALPSVVCTIVEWSTFEVRRLGPRARRGVAQCVAHH